MIIITCLSILLLITGTLAIISALKCAKAKATKDEAAAAWYGTLERISVHLFWFNGLVLLAVMRNDLLTTGFVKILTALEALQNG